MSFFFFSRVTRIKLATQVFLWEPKSDLAGVKKKQVWIWCSNDDSCKGDVYGVLDMYMVVVMAA